MVDGTRVVTEVVKFFVVDFEWFRGPWLVEAFGSVVVVSSWSGDIFRHPGSLKLQVGVGEAGWCGVDLVGSVLVHGIVCRSG